MWLTPSGARKLLGAERGLYSNALDMWIDCDMHNDFATLDVGGGIFADLSVPDKYLVLRYVTAALLTDTPPPFQSALLESTIHAVYRSQVGNWEGDAPEDIAANLIDFYMESKVYADTLEEYLPEDPDDADPPTRDTVLSALTARIRDNGTEGIVELLMDRILWDRDFELDPMAPGDPRFLMLDIDPGYWSAGPKLLQKLRKESRDAHESFGIVYWDLKASYLSTGFGGTWSEVRSTALQLEQAATPALAHPKLRKHFEGQLGTHVHMLPRRALGAVLKKKGTSGGRGAAAAAAAATHENAEVAPVEPTTAGSSESGTAASGLAAHATASRADTSAGIRDSVMPEPEPHAGAKRPRKRGGDVHTRDTT
jgi:hypothetical protein